MSQTLSFKTLQTLTSESSIVGYAGLKLYCKGISNDLGDLLTKEMIGILEDQDDETWTWMNFFEEYQDASVMVAFDSLIAKIRLVLESSVTQAPVEVDPNLINAADLDYQVDNATLETDDVEGDLLDGAVQLHQGTGYSVFGSAKASSSLWNRYLLSFPGLMPAEYSQFSSLFLRFGCTRWKLPAITNPRVAKYKSCVNPEWESSFAEFKQDRYSEYFNSCTVWFVNASNGQNVCIDHPSLVFEANVDWKWAGGDSQIITNGLITIDCTYAPLILINGGKYVSQLPENYQKTLDSCGLTLSDYAKNIAYMFVVSVRAVSVRTIETSVDLLPVVTFTPSKGFVTTLTSANMYQAYVDTVFSMLRDGVKPLVHHGSSGRNDNLTYVINFVEELCKLDDLVGLNAMRKLRKKTLLDDKLFKEGYLSANCKGKIVTCSFTWMKALPEIKLLNRFTEEIDYLIYGGITDHSNKHFQLIGGWAKKAGKKIFKFDLQGNALSEVYALDAGKSTAVSDFLNHLMEIEGLKISRTAVVLDCGNAEFSYSPSGNVGLVSYLANFASVGRMLKKDFPVLVGKSTALAPINAKYEVTMLPGIITNNPICGRMHGGEGIMSLGKYVGKNVVYKPLPGMANYSRVKSVERGNVKVCVNVPSVFFDFIPAKMSATKFGDTVGVDTIQIKLYDLGSNKKKEKHELK